MHYFWDNEKKQLKWPSVGHFGFYFCTIYHGLSLCEALHVVLYAWSSYFALILSCLNIKKLLKFKMTARQPFLNYLLPKVYQVIDWHCCPYLPNKKKICWKLFLKCATSISLLVALVTGWYMGIKMSPEITWCYLMAMWSMRKQKFIDQLSCKISEIMRKKIKWLPRGHFRFYDCEI